MSDSTVADGDKPNIKGKTSQEILAEMMAATNKDIEKEIRRAAKEWSDTELKNVPKDVRELITAKLGEKGDLSKDGKFIIPSKSKPERSPMEYVQKRFPSVFQKAETPNGELEMQSAAAACKSLAVQGQMVKAIGVQRLSELMSLVGGRVGHLSEPVAIKPDAKPGDHKGPNPFSKEKWNLTEQGRLYALNPTLAASMAAKAGTTIGALKPR